MMDDRKIWVIDDQDKPEITNLGEAVADTRSTRAAQRAVPRPHRSSYGRQSAVPANRQATDPSAARARMAAPSVHPAILLAAAYILGPLGLALTARGRRSGFWTAFGAGTAVLATGLGAAWWAVATRGESAALLPLLTLGTALCVLAGYTVWARSLELLLTSYRFPGKTWPEWVKQPWPVAFLGLLAPGVAWVFARRMRRATSIVWAGWPLGVSFLLMVQAPLIWHHRLTFASFGIRADLLEYMFVVVALATLAAPLIWIGQALLGARQTAQRTDCWKSGRSDWSAVALALAVVAMVATVRPGDLAEDLSGGAEMLRDQGFQVLPTHLATLALELNPGHPGYALQLADLYAEGGNAEAADLLRQDLDLSLQPYLGTLVREGRWQRLEAPAEPQLTEGLGMTDPSAERTRSVATPVETSSPAADPVPAAAFASMGFINFGMPAISDAPKPSAPVRPADRPIPVESAPEPDEAAAGDDGAGTDVETPR